MRRLLVVALLALTACTPAQARGWLAWWQTDPDAAVAFLDTPEGQALLDDVPAPAPAPRPSRGAGVWDRIARCESGGNWAYPPVTNRTGTYSGGLMIWTRAWVAYGGQQFAPQAWQASKAEQIVVAERILADQGWGAWDCA